MFATAAELRASFIDNQSAPAVNRTVQGANSISRLPTISHLDERKSARLTCVAIIDGSIYVIVQPVRLHQRFSQ